jgi:hypothetical protein
MVGFIEQIDLFIVVSSDCDPNGLELRPLSFAIIENVHVFLNRQPTKKMNAEGLVWQEAANCFNDYSIPAVIIFLIERYARPIIFPFDLNPGEWVDCFAEPGDGEQRWMACVVAARTHSNLLLHVPLAEQTRKRKWISLETERASVAPFESRQGLPEMV